MIRFHLKIPRVVGAAGFEPATPSPPDWCANRAALRSAGRGKRTSTPTDTHAQGWRQSHPTTGAVGFCGSIATIRTPAVAQLQASDAPRASTERGDLHVLHTGASEKNADVHDKSVRLVSSFADANQHYLSVWRISHSHGLQIELTCVWMGRGLNGHLRGTS